ncbi:type IV pilus modification PilV family protein [Pseudoteredinibacter isoporae]|uniref:General secretion pathway protein I n=1 Tax=Pseudoteredinibacter isoporae TaxID=570281 RepID=A0A7X0JRL8_9GAMM|nr:prepilin-type N-terminal cleavage/methylation domain-containing protein [Pseudoteredinibacter isoporae]MBB6521007.1 general secretion pathway protein I [Pseudoteredinibacter isoporae]NHO86572.1 prepilin-type N-terminal cleavage/methylation domain-containing protein [Pseudoteredinibacter isoporae]NIB24976.1 prepilin-type N-terminal cleavage/methylation domain-containing protein [Pseudoteredinibacter isoporae]
MTRKASQGFSLLEMLVAIAVLGFSLGALYQAVAGASRNVHLDEQYTYASVLAESLLANYQVVPIGGVQESGETEGGYAWQVITQPTPGDYPENMELGSLQNIEVTVSWNDGEKERQFQLDSIVLGSELEQ